MVEAVKQAEENPVAILKKEKKLASPEESCPHTKNNAIQLCDFANENLPHIDALDSKNQDTLLKGVPKEAGQAIVKLPINMNIKISDWAVGAVWGPKDAADKIATELKKIEGDASIQGRCAAALMVQVNAPNPTPKCTSVLLSG